MLAGFGDGERCVPSNNVFPWDLAGWSCIYVTNYKLCYKLFGGKNQKLAWWEKSEGLQTLWGFSALWGG